MAIKGQNLRVLVGGNCIAAATSCTLQISANSEDSSTKDSTGDWAENEITGKSWSVQTDSLVTLTDANSGKTTVDLASLIINATSVNLVFDQTNSTQNRTATNSTLKRTGSAYLTDFSISAQNRQNATASCTFTGNGALS